MKTLKPITREHERQLVSFLANSEEIASLASSRLAARMLERSKVLSELATQLPAAEKKCENELAKAMQASKELEKARNAFNRARLACDELTRLVDSTQHQCESLRASAFRRAAELADPRIDDLRRWVLRLENVVRAEPVEIELIRFGELRGRMVTNGQSAVRLLAAMTRLGAIAQELSEMITAPYGDELVDVLMAKKRDAEAIASTVLKTAHFEVLIESAPDLFRLPLPLN